MATAVVAVWVAPIVAGHTPLVSWIACRVAKVNGRVHLDSASLGWFSPVKLYGLKIIDPEDHTLVDVPEVRGDRWLAAMLWDAADLGAFRFKRPKFRVVLRDNGSNLKDTFADYLTLDGKTRIAVAVKIADGSVSIEDTPRQRAWQVDQFDLDFNLPGDRSRCWELKTSGMLAGAPTGAFDLTMRMQQAAEGGVVTELLFTEGNDGAEAAGPDFVSLKTDHLSLEVLSLIFRRSVPGMRLAGQLSGNVEYRWDSKRPDRLAMVKANAVAEEIGLAGCVLSGDEPTLARLRVEGSTSWQNGVVEFDRVTTESDIGSLSLSGTFDFRSHLWTAVRQGYEVAGQIDLARLAVMLPNTLKLQKNTQITSGRVQLAVTGRPGTEGTAWQGRLEVSNFAAKKGGWPVAWQRPILVTLAARETAQGPFFDNLKWESGILKMQASGTPSRLRQSLGVLMN